ncbi:hypothetical protein OH690_01410 [Escherichia coli]|nr:hypothetical protein [Escherichia coli]
MLSKGVLSVRLFSLIYG